jgi:hypothetical protein
MATETDLRSSGATTTIGGAIFQDSANLGAGTGGYNTILAVQDNNDPGTAEAGFNTDDTPPIDASNREIDHAKTETVLLANVPIKVLASGIAYYEFRVDLNESNSDPTGQISLDQFIIRSSTSNALQTKAQFDAASLVYDMDSAATGGDRTLLLSEVSTGSGTDDYSVLVPVSNFAGIDPTTTYMYLFVEMGAKDGDYGTNGGFEEWNLQKAGTLTGIKFEDKNADGIYDANGADNLTGTGDDETGVGGVTIFIDNDKDGVLDSDERSTVTNADGSYTFYGVPVADKPYQIDEVIPTGRRKPQALSRPQPLVQWEIGSRLIQSGTSFHGLRSPSTRCSSMCRAVTMMRWPMRSAMC